MFIELLFISILPWNVFGFDKSVVIGGLFGDDELIGRAFQLSAMLLNQNRHYDDELPNQLINAQLLSTAEDVYEVHETVCQLADTGIVAIFGPQDTTVNRYVQSMCGRMDIPHFAAKWNARLKGDSLINMYPHADSVSGMYLQLVKDYQWKTFTIIYENNESLVRVNQLLKRWDPKGYTVTVRQLPEGPDYRDALRDIKHSYDYNIVLDCSIDILPEVLKQAQQVGIMSDKHSFIITSLNLQTVDLEPYQYGGTNFTGFRLIDPDDDYVMQIFEENIAYWGLESPSQITVEAALIFDGVQLFGRLLRQLDNDESNNTASQPNVQSLLCKNDLSWNLGDNMVNFKSSIEMNGLTGLIKFDRSGDRKNFEVDIINLNSNGVGKIGRYNSSTGINFLPKPSLIDPKAGLSLRNRTFIVLIALTPPYGMLKESSKEESGNERYEGFGIDIIDKLSQALGFNYTFEVQVDNIYGELNKTTKKWNGMIREIMEDRADLAITDLTITAERNEAVDFTMPFMNLGISILFTKPKPAGSSLFSFLSPFSNEVWMYLMGAYTFVSLLLFIIGRLCPSEWNNPYPCIEEPEELENQFTLKNSYWFTIGSIMQQGSEIAPIGLSTRMMAGSWWFFCLIIVSSYTANLAVFLVVESKETLIKSAADLVDNKHGIKYGAKKSGSTLEFFKTTEDPVYKKLWKYMEAHQSEVMMPTNDAGVEKVSKELYAYFMESSTIKYQAERKCDLMQVGDLLDAKGYGIAMKKHSPYRNDLTAEILRLQETGVLRTLEEKWWKQQRGGGNCEDKKGGTSDANALGLDNVGGVFVVLITGVALACVYTALEFVWTIGCTSINEKVSFKEELKEEVKFVVRCSKASKPVRRRKGSSQSNQSNDEDNVRNSTPPYGLVPTVITTTPEEK